MVFIDLAPCNCFYVGGEEPLLFYDQEFVAEEEFKDAKDEAAVSNKLIKYAMYRTIKYYFASSRPAREVMKAEELMERYGITPDMFDELQEREDRFLEEVRNTSNYDWLYKSAAPDYKNMLRRAEKSAEADLVKRQKNAEAEKYEQEKDAEAKKAQAEAQKYAAEQEAAGIKAKYDAEAAGIAAKGLAEAEAIKAKGLAEAEAMEKKAEAYKKYNGAAMAEMMIKIMPQMAAEIAKPLSQIDKINIYGTGDGNNGASQISGNMPIVMKQVFDTMSEATGVDFTEIMRAGTYDAKVNRNINLSGEAVKVNVSDTKPAE